MKKVLYLVLSLVLLAGCGAKAAPEWIKTSHNQLESYKKHFLQGRDRLAEMNFQKAVSDVKSGGDLRLMQVAYLTRYALQTAVLERFDDRDYRKLESVEPHPENIHYHAFLQGAFNRVEERSLPPQYHRFLSACKNGKQTEIDLSIEAIEDPMSRLIASGLAVREQFYQERTLQTAIGTAAEQGWKKALLTYLKKLRDFYASINEQDKAGTMQQRIDLLQ